MGITRNSSGGLEQGYYWDGISGSLEWSYTFGSYHPLAGINDNSLSGGADGSLATYWKVGDGGVTGFGKLSATDLAQVYGLNDQNCLVGESGDKAFLFDLSDNSLLNLNDFLPTGTPFSQLAVAYDINNSGMFVGVGIINGVEHGFVGQIVPEPSGLVLLGIGGGVMVIGWQRRRRVV